MTSFTVFTPTYNRAQTIHRVYDSLVAQTFRDFEWVVVDDGSTDNTRELVANWIKEADFPIRYFFQENGHKKKAFNHGVKLAKGRFLLPADSDDSFPEHTLETFLAHWKAIPDEEKSFFLGVCGLCVYESGDLVGTRFPGQWGVDSTPAEIRFRFGVTGDKTGIILTEILLAHTFPDHLPGHVPEGVVWSVIGSKYKTRFVNEVMRCVYCDSGNQITKSGQPQSAAAGTLYWKKIVLTYEIRWFFSAPLHFLLEAARWTRFRLHVKNTKALDADFWPTTLSGGCLVIAMAPIGLLWWIFDKARG